jgi:hypothetical protein
MAEDNSTAWHLAYSKRWRSDSQPLGVCDLATCRLPAPDVAAVGQRRTEVLHWARMVKPENTSKWLACRLLRIPRCARRSLTQIAHQKCFCAGRLCSFLKISGTWTHRNARHPSRTGAASSRRCRCARLSRREPPQPARAVHAAVNRAARRYRRSPVARKPVSNRCCRLCRTTSSAAWKTFCGVLRGDNAAALAFQLLGAPNTPELFSRRNGSPRAVVLRVGPLVSACSKYPTGNSVRPRTALQKSR